MQQADLFLSNELAKEFSFAARRRRIGAQVTGCVRREDFYYAILLPDSQLSYFEEVTWVEIRGENFSQYGSLWLADEKNPYLLLGQPIAVGRVQVIEADGIKLLEMQRQAFSALKAGATSHSQKIMNIITNQESLHTIGSKCDQVSFHDRRVEEVESQSLAVKKALQSCGEKGFFLIHGPPGTGKTTVITEIVRQLVGKGQKVLITSHTNVAVDNVLENLFPYFATRMVRLGTKIKVTSSLKSLVPKTQDELIKLSLSQVVGATLSKLSVLVLNQKLSFDVPYFDVVIIDESSMATIPLTLCGVLLAKSFILVGDHKQLPPIAKTVMPPSCSSAQNCGRNCESLFKLLITLYPDSSTMLELQFRSHPAIMGFSSKQFYDNRIQSSKSCYEKKLDLPKDVEHGQVKGLINQNPVCYVAMNYEDRPYDKPVEWFPSRDESGQRSVQPSCFNRYEAAVALKVRHELIRAGVPAESIWIITPYRLQREIIRRAIRKIYGSLAKDAVLSIYENLTASTVDSIQGKENDVVIYVLTWTPSGGRESQVHIALKDYRRLNVAMTRAKKKLIIIGDIGKLSYQYPYGPLEKYMNTNGVVVSAPLLRDNDDFLTVVDRCYDEKRKVMNHALVQEAKEAKKRLQQDIFLPISYQKFAITDDQSFDSLRASGEWEDLSPPDKLKCYEFRKRGLPYEIEINYEQETKEKSINVIPKARTYGMVSNISRREPPSHISHADRSKNLPTLISFQDFRECGAVCNYLREHLNANDNEVAKNTRLPLDRVSSLRAYLKLDGTLKRQVSTSNVIAPSARETVRVCPVHVNETYDVTIGERGRFGDCIARINGFVCFVPNATEGERVTVMVQKIHGDYAEAVIVRRIIEPSVPAVNPLIARVQSKTNTNRMADDEAGKQRCPSCGEKVTRKEIETHDGFCMQCWLKELQKQAGQAERRSGIYGADRAGTW